MVGFALLDIVRLGLGGAVAAVGIGFVLGGAIGLLRFPDFYTRVHAASTTAGVGAVLVVVGLAVSAPDLSLALRLALLGALMAALNPALAHIVASAAHAAGLAPLSGRYAAPRPGAPTRGESLP
jgi:multicomponent Na+:H+ antiporter subunit G